MSKIAVVFGTRPEFIKLYPVIKELRYTENEVLVVNTNQQKELIKSLNADFNMTFDYQYNSDFNNTSLNDRLLLMMEFLNKTLKEVDKIVVQGDTLSAMAAALIGFNSKAEVYHVEAGLRTYDIEQPFPEESYRRIITSVAKHHFAVTESNKENLINEGILEYNISVMGNTIYDTLNEVLISKEYYKENSILITTHRKENQGQFHKELTKVIKKVNDRYDTDIFVLKHPNKSVQSNLLTEIKNFSNVKLINPMNYRDFINFLSRMKLIITDSGGIVEEVIELNVPTIIIREKTERHEALECKNIKIAHNIDQLEHEINMVMRNHYEVEKSGNPYKKFDNASKIIADKITRKGI